MAEAPNFLPEDLVNLLCSANVTDKMLYYNVDVSDKGLNVNLFWSCVPPSNLDSGRPPHSVDTYQTKIVSRAKAMTRFVRRNTFSSRSSPSHGPNSPNMSPLGGYGEGTVQSNASTLNTEKRPPKRIKKMFKTVKRRIRPHRSSKLDLNPDSTDKNSSSGSLTDEENLDIENLQAAALLGDVFSSTTITNGYLGSNNASIKISGKFYQHRSAKQEEHKPNDISALSDKLQALNTNLPVNGAASQHSSSGSEESPGISFG